MAYDTPVRISYYLGAHDYGNGAGAFAIKPPEGLKQGKVVDIHLAVTETFNQVTTPGYCRVGTAGDADKYAELNCGAAAITDAYNLGDGGTVNLDIDLTRDSISQVEVVMVAPTGGTPAGIAHTTVVIDWF